MDNTSRWFLGLFGLFIIFLVSAACTSQQPGPNATPRPFTGKQILQLTPAPNVAGSPQNGLALFSSKGCVGCHTITGVPGANGVNGPTLNNVGLRPTIAGDQIVNTPENMVRWIIDPPQTKSGSMMPVPGNISQQEAQDLAAFLYSQPYNSQRR